MKNKIDKLKKNVKLLVFKMHLLKMERSPRVEINISKILIKGLYPEYTREVFNP